MAPKKKYTEDTVKKAIKLVKEGTGIKTAAKICGVPKSTLHRRQKDNKPKKQGERPGLSKNDECQIVSYAKYKANIGAPVSFKWLRETAGRIADRC